MTDAIQSALSGLLAASARVNTHANNIANARTIGGLGAGQPQPYAAQVPVSTTTDSGGVITQSIDKTPAFTTAYAPNSPFADDSGQIGIPHVNIAEEIVGMKTAALAYKANIKTLETSLGLFQELGSVLDKKS